MKKKAKREFLIEQLERGAHTMLTAGEWNWYADARVVGVRQLSTHSASLDIDHKLTGCCCCLTARSS